jgi:hypothetical protein
LINKVDVVAHDTLVKIVVDFFSDAEIEEGKNVLFASCASDQRNKVRRGPEKSSNNVSDMIAVLQKLNEKDIPRFVVHDLSRIPPIDMNSLDVSGMARQIKSLKSDISNVNAVSALTKDMDSMKTVMEDMANQISQLVVSMSDMQEKHDKRWPELPKSIWDIEPSGTSRFGPSLSRSMNGTGISFVDSVGIGAAKSNDGRHGGSGGSLGGAGGGSGSSVSGAGGSMGGADGGSKGGAGGSGGSMGGGAGGSKGGVVDGSSVSLGAAAGGPKGGAGGSSGTLRVAGSYQGGSDSNRISGDHRRGTTDADGFSQVGGRQRKPRQLIVGKSGTASGRLRIQKQRICLFLSRLMPDVETNDIKSYIRDQFKVDVMCEKLKTRFETYSSFKIEGFCDNVKLFYDAEQWPMGVLVRRFFPPRDSNGE